MIKQFGQNDPKMISYAEVTFSPEEKEFDEIRNRSERAGIPPIHVGPFDGLHLEVLARMLRPEKIVEIGTLSGLSGLRLARSLASNNGRLYTFEYAPKHAQVAEETFRKSGVSEQVKVFVGPALNNLPKIENEGPFDLVFIDADKANYPNYAKWAIKHLKVGGVIIGDNTFGWGFIEDHEFESEAQRLDIAGLREFNHLLATHPQFKATILPTHEGLTVAVKIRS